MKVLKVYLNRVEKENNKIKNVVSYRVNNEKEMAQRLALHEGNIKKTELMNPKI